MSFTDAKKFSLEVALGNVPGYAKINKFGEALDCNSGVPTDVWDGADGATSTDIWVAPTVARLHVMASTSGNDAAAGSGMQTMQVYGLTDWDTAEVSEVVSVGDTTSNSYVIIHRIEGLTFGAGGTNAGIVTATAQTDNTVTAAIQTGEGQTLMAIYGVPSTQTLQMTFLDCLTLRASGAGVKVDGTLFVKKNADLSTAGFVNKHRFKASDTKDFERPFDPPKSFPGPCIVKVQVNASANTTITTSSFDAYVVDN